MLKARIIPVLTFNGFALVKTRNFDNPRMVGNPIQSARVFNSRNVDELIFLDIKATKENRKLNLNLVEKVINECFMPVGIGGGIKNLNDINNLLKIGADKVVIKTEAILNPTFIKKASDFFGSSCISISVDIIRDKNSNKKIFFDQNQIDMKEFLIEMESNGAGEFIINDVSNDGVMNGFDSILFKEINEMISLPFVPVGGGGKLEHYSELFKNSNCYAVGSSSIFSFTRFTPNDIKNELSRINVPVRLI